MSLTELVHFLHPVRILVEVIIIGRTALVVVNLDHVTCGCTLAWVEVRLFQHHGVAVAVKHVQSAWSPRTGETVREVDFCLTCHTTLGVDLNHTVSTAGTPDGRGGSVFQHLDFLDVLWVHRQESGKLLLVVEVLKVHFRHVVRKVEDVAIDNDQWLGATVDGAHTTHTHTCSRTQVT